MKLQTEMCLIWDTFCPNKPCFWVESLSLISGRFQCDRRFCCCWGAWTRLHVEWPYNHLFHTNTCFWIPLRLLSAQESISEHVLLSCESCRDSAVCASNLLVVLKVQRLHSQMCQRAPSCSSILSPEVQSEHLGGFSTNMIKLPPQLSWSSLIHPSSDSLNFSTVHQTFPHFSQKVYKRSPKSDTFWIQ